MKLSTLALSSSFITICLGLSKQHYLDFTFLDEDGYLRIRFSIHADHENDHPQHGHLQPLHPILKPNTRFYLFRTNHGDVNAWLPMHDPATTGEPTGNRPEVPTAGDIRHHALTHTTGIHYHPCSILIPESYELQPSHTDTVLKYSVVSEAFEQEIWWKKRVDVVGPAEDPISVVEEAYEQNAVAMDNRISRPQTPTHGGRAEAEGMMFLRPQRGTHMGAPPAPRADNSSS